jgi:hypothetical protein
LLVLLGQFSRLIDIEDDPSPDTGDNCVFEDSATIGGTVLFAGRTHQGINSGIGASEFDSQGMYPESFLPVGALEDPAFGERERA